MAIVILGASALNIVAQRVAAKQQAARCAWYDFRCKRRAMAGFLGDQYDDIINQDKPSGDYPAEALQPEPLPPEADNPYLAALKTGATSAGNKVVSDANKKLQNTVNAVPGQVVKKVTGSSGSSSGTGSGTVGWNPYAGKASPLKNPVDMTNAELDALIAIDPSTAPELFGMRAALIAQRSSAIAEKMLRALRTLPVVSPEMKALLYEESISGSNEPSAFGLSSNKLALIPVALALAVGFWAAKRS